MWVFFLVLFLPGSPVTSIEWLLLFTVLRLDGVVDWSAPVVALPLLAPCIFIAAVSLLVLLLVFLKSKWHRMPVVRSQL
jgi:hypothetical protein